MFFSTFSILCEYFSFVSMNRSGYSTIPECGLLMQPIGLLVCPCNIRAPRTFNPKSEHLITFANSVRLAIHSE